jgi:maleate cis-trans isomerase
VTNAANVKIGWLGPSLPSTSHMRSFHKLVPSSIAIVYEQLILHKGELNDVRGKLDYIVERAAHFAEAEGFDALIFPGAPREVLNPGLFAALSASLNVPVTTALRASAAALQASDAGRVLLLTPFDTSLNGAIRDFLGQFAITAVSPSEVLGHYTDALQMTPRDVVAYAKRAIAETPSVEGIYFQGAVLDPMDSLDAMEAELKVPVVASNAAMLWHILSKLGRRHPMSGYGKLLATWPALAQRNQSAES